MKKALLSFIVCAIIATTFSNCKKYDDGPTLSLKSKKSRVANVWKYDKVIAPGGADITSSYVDQYVEFKKDGSYILTDGQYSDPGTWQFGNDKNDIILSGVSEAWHILRLKNNELWVNWEYSSGGLYECHLAPR